MSIIGGLKAGGGTAAFRQAKLNLATWAGFLRRTPRGGAGRGMWPAPGRLVLGGAVTLAILAAVVVIADARAIVGARALPAEIHAFFQAVTEFGKSGWFLWPIGVVLLVLGLTTSPRVGRIGTLVVAAVAVRLTFVFAAIAVSGLFVAIIKRLIGRARPFVGGSANPNLYDPSAWTPAYASLPSGHATTSFAAAAAIGALWPGARPALWCYALIIAVSRVVITAHHPSDVLAGAVAGVVGAILVRNWFAARRLAFTIGEGGRVRSPPAPSWRRIKAVARNLCGA